MQTARDYTIMRRGVYFDLKEMKPVDQKSKDTVYFPSQGEFKCFKILLQIFTVNNYTVKIHPRLKTSACDWSIDFKIIPNTDTGRLHLAKLCNFFNGSDFCRLPYLFVEYKGFADRNFRYKFGILYQQCPSLHQTIILIGSQQSVYTDRKNGYKRNVWDIDQFKDHCAMIS